MWEKLMVGAGGIMVGAGGIMVGALEKLRVG